MATKIENAQAKVEAAIAALIRAVREDEQAEIAKRIRGDTSSAGQRKRAMITQEKKNEVKKLAGDGHSEAEIARLAKISQSSVHNIRKELGLVKKTKA